MVGAAVAGVAGEGGALGDGAVVAVTSGVRVALGVAVGAEPLGVDVAGALDEGGATTGCVHAASVNATTAIERRQSLTPRPSSPRSLTGPSAEGSRAGDTRLYPRAQGRCHGG